MNEGQVAVRFPQLKLVQESLEVEERRPILDERLREKEILRQKLQM